MTDPKDRPKLPIVKTRVPGKKPGVFDNLRPPTPLPAAEPHPIEEILGLGTLRTTDSTQATSAQADSAQAITAEAITTPAVQAEADHARAFPAPAIATGADFARTEPAQVLIAPAYPAQTARLAEPGQESPRPDPTPPKSAPAISARAVPALAYELEGMSRLRTYVAREHWIDDEFFRRYRMSAAEQVMMRQIWRLTLGFGRLSALCSMERMAERCVMPLTTAKATRKSLVERQVITTEGRSNGPLESRGQVWRLLEPAIPPAEFPGILEACEAAKAQAESESARAKSAQALRAAANPARMKEHEIQDRKWTSDRLQTVAVQMIDDARQDGEAPPTIEQIDRELRKTMRRVGAQAGVDFQDSDIIGVARKWGREGDR